RGSRDGLGDLSVALVDLSENILDQGLVFELYERRRSVSANVVDDLGSVLPLTGLTSPRLCGTVIAGGDGDAVHDRGLVGGVHDGEIERIYAALARTCCGNRCRRWNLCVGLDGLTVCVCSGDTCEV